MLAPIRILFRTKEAVELCTLPDTSTLAIAAATSANNSNSKKKGGRILYKGATSFHLLNPNGTKAYVHDSNIGIVECNLETSVDVKAVEEEATIVPTKETIPFLEESKAVQLAKCSPRGSFLLTWERPITTAGNNDSSVDNVGGNLKVWDATNGKLVRGFHCKKATLNTIQWTHDESLLFHLVTNEIHVYSTTATNNSSSSSSRVGRIVCKSIISFSLPAVIGKSSSNTSLTTTTTTTSSSSSKYLLTTFISGSKGKPARIDLLRYPDRLGRDSSTINNNTHITTTTGATIASGVSLASKSLFDAEECSVVWSPRANAALVQTSTSIDATGESYYGSSHLFLLAEEDTKHSGNGSAIAVTLPKESNKTSSGIIPILHAAWIPNPTIVGPVPFGLISGTMPSLSSLHHGVTGEPIFLLGRAHRNIMDISPHGRFVVCGGYGNLAGGMDFWDRNKGKRISRRIILPNNNNSTKEEENDATSTTSTTNYVTMKDGNTKLDLSITSSRPVVGHSWSPDSRTYIVSTTSPRMNVDNGVTVYRYDGSALPDCMVPWDNSRYRPDKLLCVEYIPGPLVSMTEDGGGGGKEFYYYPDRPQSPPPKGMIELKGDVAELALTKLLLQPNTVNGSESSGSGTNGNAAVPVAAPAAYVPPAARGTSGGGGAYKPPGARGSGRGGGVTSLAERMRKEREGSAVNVSGVKVVQRTGQLVGASSVISTATTTANASTEAEKSASAIRREKQRLAKEKAEREAAELEQRKVDEEQARIIANKTDPEKRSKKLVKLLKQIDDIKLKLINGDELNDDQKKKMESEEELRKELASLGI
jgi:translation initiation factor 2A